MPFMAQSWSIGVEEQFYLIWPWLVRWSKNYLTVLASIFFGLILITNVLYFFADLSLDISHTSTSTKAITFAYKFFALMRISCMAVGGIGAVLLYNSNMKILRPLFLPMTQIAVLGCVLFMMFLGVEIPRVNHEFYALFFIVLILNLAGNPKTLFNLEYKWIDYLGKISYSIYMWHGVAIICGLHIARFFYPNLDNAAANIIYYVSTFIHNLLIASVSYEWFEKRFLRFKHFFAKIQSGNLDKNTEGGSDIEGGKVVTEEPVSVPSSRLFQ